MIKRITLKIVASMLLLATFFMPVAQTYAAYEIFADTSAISSLTPIISDTKTNFDNTSKIVKIVQENIQNIAEDVNREEERIGTKKNIAEYASSFVGWLPYVWAGASLETGADCCGFTMAIYQHFGYTIGRTVDAQAIEGTSVSLENAEPGDIVVYSGHVGLYAGNEKVIHSPHSGTCVSIDSVYMMPILDIRRII